MDLRNVLNDDLPRTVCSAKACRATAVVALRWNNPKLHDPARRKIWLACAEHETPLREFLSMRGFYRETVGVDALGPDDG